MEAASCCISQQIKRTAGIGMTKKGKPLAIKQENMRQLYTLFMIALLTSCKQSPKKESETVKQEAVQEEAPKPKVEAVVPIGEKISGDFNGDGKQDFAVVVRTKERVGNPAEDGTPAEYEIQFPDSNFKPISAGCCEIMLINEGDLTNDGADEVSVFQAPANGCVYSMSTYSYTNGNWQCIVKPFLIPTGCEGLSSDDLQKRVFREDNVIYFYDTDLNDENGGLIKRQVKN